MKSGLLLLAIFALCTLGQAQNTQAKKSHTYFLLSLDKNTNKKQARLYKYQNRGILHIQDVIGAMRRGMMQPDRSPEWGCAQIPGKKYRNGLNFSRPIAARSGDTFCFAVKTSSLKSIFLNGFVTMKTPNFRTKNLKREFIIITLPQKTDNHYFDERGIASIMVYGYHKSEKKVFGTLIISRVSKNRYDEFMATNSK